MTKKHFKWKATLDDGTKIKQFNENDEETLFKELLDQNGKTRNDLKLFEIVADDGEKYKVDLVNGSLDCRSEIQSVNFEIPEGEKAELIYFRRNHVRLKIGTGEKLEDRTTHIIGLKYKDDTKEVHVFPGLKLAKRKIELKSFIKGKKENIDITKKI